MMMPNFLIIGAAKSGTTSLYHYLNQHPQIYMSPVKEPRFFALEGEKPDFRGPEDRREINRRSITDIDAYRALFKGVANERAIGEASPLYLYSRKAPGRIRHHIPEVKLIAILRDPVERAFSSYLHCVRSRGEPLKDFAQALQEEEARIENHWGPIWHYKNVGFYYVQLQRYFDTFRRDQIKVYLYEDMESNASGMLQDVFRFLEVDDAFIPDVFAKHNVGGIPKNRLLYELLNKQNPIKSAFKPLFPAKLRRPLNRALTGRNLAKPQLSPEMREHLTEQYREDILNLQELIQRDLSKWLR